ncbi:MAG: hypothetical protein IMF08_16180 [Proteobacteria bacterium]|nr:hypothetical protein [Pseudomonadota bacterium]MCK4867401.1 hypothetical protein [Alphaproteobacteria bacterium]
MSETVRWLVRWAVVACAAAFLAGCSGDEDEDTSPCPAAKVLGEPSELTKFRDGPGLDPTDILFKARMMRVVGECSYDLDGGEIEIELEVVMEAVRGAALVDGKVAFGYFVAVAEWVPGGGSEPVVHSREAFQVQTRIPSGRRGLRYTDMLEITIPRPDDRNVQNYVLYLGFELTKEELFHNRERFGQ